jgi:hypothetical protein
MNYATLVSTIENYCENTESLFVSSIPTFVQLAEERIYNTVQIPAIRKNQTGAMTGGDKYLTLPTDWLATFSLSVIDPVTAAQSFLLNKDVNYIREAYPTPSSTGTPAHYAQFSDTALIVGPTPDANYGVELHYYYYPESIVTAGTSWVGNNFETVLLYGSLREAQVFMKGEADIIANYESKYQESMMLLKVLGDGKDRRDAYRSGQARIAVP